MAVASKGVDKVRASRDGHEYHEAWAARKAMQLLFPHDGLIGIAVEGLEPADQQSVSASTAEVADLTLYHGERPTFQGAERVAILQFKYSVAGKNKQFRAAEAKETIAKFAAAYRDHKKHHSGKAVARKLRFELITNRPSHPNFEKAVHLLANGRAGSGDCKRQMKQVREASGLSGKALADFARMFTITGLAGTLKDSKKDLSTTLVDWSASQDAMAFARLGALRQLVRDKAGTAGTGQNVIRRTDVLTALEVPDVDDLLPCPESLPDIGPVVEREQLQSALALIPTLDRPLLIHATGGVGKTVFLKSMAKALSEKHEVVFFDCFGGGSYRSPHDARHLPRRGLVHIANVLASRGRCDPILPGSQPPEMLFTTFRRRLAQCVKTLSRASPNRHLILFMDAIDNAAELAKDRGEPSFPTQLLESLQGGDAVPGVKLVVSCRSYNKGLSVKNVPCVDFLLKPFTLSETRTYLQARTSGLTETEAQVAQARSGGNARILEHLATSDRGLLDPSERDNPIQLDDLLRDRIDTALAEALKRGYQQEQIDAFLAGLAVLPPPVPIDEYAAAHEMDVSTIESFAADLAPLLERTQHGLMFRDEPTETLIRRTYIANETALRRVAGNLFAHQGTSVYAARVLPDLLQQLNDGEKLFDLAFDDRFPAAVSSAAGHRHIRRSRIRAAIRHAVENRNT